MRSAEKTHRSRPGDQITVWPWATPCTMSDATLEGSTAKGAGERPEVILVRTKPGRTICTGDAASTKGFAQSLREAVESGLR